MRLLIGSVGLMLAATLFSARAAATDFAARVEYGEQLSRSGNLNLALEQLQPAYQSAATPADKARAANALGVTFYRMHRYKDALPLLMEAIEAASDPRDKARHANDLGNLFAAQRDIDVAYTWYERALELALGVASLQAAARLNLARLASVSDKPNQLSVLVKEIPKIADLHERARYALNLGAQSAALGPKGLKLAHQGFDLARSAATSLNDPRLLAEALDGLSQLYEDQKRDAEALRLADRGAVSAQSADARDLLIRLEWRRGRLLKRLNKPDQALAAYQRAVDHIEAIRQDIPVEYQDGKSSFRETLEPVYLGLADLLLIEADKQTGAPRLGLYRRARDTLELIKQSELEDFLGDRCMVNAVRRASASSLPPHTAVLYPIILPDRLDLLLETSQGIERRSVPLVDMDLRKTATLFAARLRAGKKGYEDLGRKLYDWLLRPVEGILQETETDTVIFVPDGVLRLVPIGALHDGSRFAVQKYAIATVPGLSMIDVELVAKREPRILLAGLSEPGSVVNKIPPALLKMLLPDDVAGQSAEPDTSLPTSRALVRQPAISPTVSSSGSREVRLREQLALPGVKQEIEALGRSVKGETLLNQTFTLDHFKEQVSGGEFRVVHIASHGVFSSSADASFIMTYDDLLTLDGLQSLLRSEKLRDQPIELLTLSACQTAEGDDRAPLGLAGAALKARAKSAMGTLWPVADEAATALMPHFYHALGQAGTTKIKALQQAQLSLLEKKDFNHPFYWAPFILVGSWQ